MSESKRMMVREIVVRNIKKERDRLKKYQEEFRRKEGERKRWIR